MLPPFFWTSHMSLIREFVAALNRRDALAAAALARQMLTNGMPLGQQWRAVAQFAAVSAEWTVAIAAAERYVDAVPGTPGVLFLADILVQAERHEQALNLVTPMAEANPTDGAAWHFLGTLLSQMGDAERGQACFEHALDLPAVAPETWLSWALAQSFVPESTEFSRILAAADRVRASPTPSLAPILYAAAKAKDDVGDSPGAVNDYRTGAALVVKGRRYDAAADERAVLALVGAAAPVTKGTSCADGRAIFVFGRPRSGTTLIEQILASHAAVAGGGELNLVAATSRACGDLPLNDDLAISRFRHHYLHLLTERYGESGRVVDKTLNTSRLLGAVGTAFPDSPLIWVHRDPLDTAWSCFKTYFAQGVTWSFDLVAMGRYFALEDLLHRHWKSRLGDRLLDVPYQSLVTEPQHWIGRMLAHCQLEADPAVFEFHKTRRAVTTTSYRQVRQPIYRSALDSGAPYRDVLQPFVTAYRAARQAYGLADLAL
jgi:tetratricopeptide (TPR) repeat protein